MNRMSHNPALALDPGSVTFPFDRLGSGQVNRVRSRDLSCFCSGSPRTVPLPGTGTL